MEAEERVCRICRGGEVADEVEASDESCIISRRSEPLLSPCSCKGSCGLVHASCILAWLSAQPSLSSCCEVCHAPYHLQWRAKPFSQWRGPSVGKEDILRLRLSLLSCILTLADILFCAASFARPGSLLGPRSLHSLMLIVLSISWGYCFGVNIYFWLQLLLRWRRQNLELKL